MSPVYNTRRCLRDACTRSRDGSRRPAETPFSNGSGVALHCSPAVASVRVDVLRAKHRLVQRQSAAAARTARLVPGAHLAPLGLGRAEFRGVGLRIRS